MAEFVEGGIKEKRGKYSGEFFGESVASGGRLESWEAIIVRTTCPMVERIARMKERGGKQERRIDTSVVCWSV